MNKPEKILKEIEGLTKNILRTKKIIADNLEIVKMWEDERVKLFTELGIAVEVFKGSKL